MNKVARRIDIEATNKAKEIFGDIVDSAWVAVELSDSETSNSIDDLLDKRKPVIHDDSIEVCPCEQVWLLFTNGKMVEFSISEWGYISPVEPDKILITMKAR